MTQKEIAQMLGVSRSTVSMVLSGSDKVKKETRDRVLKMVDDVSYQPNAFARSLLMKRSFTIAVVLPDLSHPFFSEMQELMYKKLSEKGYTSIFFSIQGVNQIQKINTFVSSWKIDGMISCLLPIGMINRLKMKNIPIVTYYNSGIEGVSSVSNEHYYGAIKAVNHFVKLGYREIGHIGRCSFRPDERFRGYMTACTEAGIYNPDYNLDIDFGWEINGYNAMQEYLKRNNKRARAFLCFDDNIAIGAMKACWDAGLSVPDEIAFIGIGNFRVGEFTHPALTSIDQHRTAIVDSLIDILIREIDGKDTREEHILLQPELIIRQSCGSK